MFLNLHTKKYRDESETFLLEGLTLIEEAINAKIQIQLAAYTEHLLISKNGKELFSYIRRLNLQLILVSENVMSQISTLTTPPGIIAIAKTPKSNIAINKSLKNILILEEIQDPGNLGTILRTALGSGCSGVVSMKKTVDFYNPKVIRGSMGAIFHIPCESGWDYANINIFKKQGVRIITPISHHGVPYWEADLSGPIAFILGNEAKGASKEALALSDQTVTIPIDKRTDSLNVAVAAGILLFEAIRQNNDSARPLRGSSALQDLRPAAPTNR